MPPSKGPSTSRPPSPWWQLYEGQDSEDVDSQKSSDSKLKKCHSFRNLFPSAKLHSKLLRKSLSTRYWTRCDVRITAAFLAAWFICILVVSYLSPPAFLPPASFAMWIGSSWERVGVDCRKAVSELSMQTTPTHVSPPLSELSWALPFSCSGGKPMGSHTARLSLLTQLKTAPVTLPHEITHHSVDESGKISHHNAVLQVDNGPLVTVVVPFRNDALTLNASIQSLLVQSYTHIEVILVDDGSQDGSSEIASVLADADSRVKVLKSPFPRNSGKFVAVNYGMVNGRGRLITFQDADDVSHPARLEAQVRFLERFHGVMYVSPLCVRISNNLLLLDNRGVVQRESLAAAMFRRSLLNEIGYFDSVHSLADEEFLRRVVKGYGHRASKQVVVRDRKHLTQVPLYYDFVSDETAAYEYQHATGHTAQHATGHAAGRSFSTNELASYSSAFTEWHERSESPFVEFPMRNRPFGVAAGVHGVTSQFSGQKVIASMATCRRRMDVLHQALDTLVPQVDRLYVYLNDFKQSELPASAKYDNVIYFDAPLGDISDNGKIYPLHLTEPYSFRSVYKDAYVFTVDDDVLYPRDYVTRMILKIEEEKRQAVFGVHCVWLQKNQTRYYEGRRVRSFYRDLPTDANVHVLGTGTTAWHHSLLPHLTVQSFPVPGMADIWLAVDAVHRNIPLKCVGREHSWLQHIETNNSIWTDHSKGGRSDRVQTEALKELYPGYFAWFS